jgi:hypothetical protein
VDWCGGPVVKGRQPLTNHGSGIASTVNDGEQGRSKKGITTMGRWGFVLLAALWSLSCLCPRVPGMVWSGSAEGMRPQVGPCLCVFSPTQRNLFSGEGSHEGMGGGTGKGL